MPQATALADWTQALLLVEQAAGLTQPQRQHWRQSLGSQSPAVLVLLDKLLQAQAQVETADFLEHLPVLDESQAIAGSRWGAGQIVAGYELQVLLGEGGMGSVWQARYVDQRLQRQVAIKFPRWRETWQGAPDQHLHHRMARERDILTALDHPHIARLLDAGVSAEGDPYLVLEWVDGMALDRYADQQQLGIDDRLRLMLQVLEAVDYAHRHLVLHRDIKPANILVNAEGHVKLLDFGVAKLLPTDEVPAAALEDTLTRAQAPALTLAFASPEQLRREPLSTASDVYACGVLLYRLLTGQAPHRPARDSRAALEEAILNGQTRWASRCEFSVETAQARGLTPKALARALRGDLDTLLAMAIKPLPQERYASAHAMAQDVQRYLRREALQARADSAWYVAWRWVQGHRWPVAAGVVVTAAVLGSAGVALHQARRAEAEAQSAQQASQRSAAAQQFLSGILAWTDPERNLGVGEYNHQLLDHAFKTATAQFASEPETLAVILQQLGDIYRRQGQPQRHLEIQRERWRLVGQAPGIDPGLKLDALADLGWALSDSSDDAERDSALQRLQEAVALARDETLVLPAASRVRALGYLASELNLRNQLNEAAATALEALRWAQAHLPNPHPLLAFAHTTVAVTSAKAGDIGRAREAFAHADAIDQSGRGRGLVDQVITLIFWAEAENQAGEYQRATSLSLRSLARGESELGANGDILTPARILAVASMLRQGQVTRATSFAAEAFSADLASTDAFRTGRAHALIGMVATVAGQFDVAERELKLAHTGLQGDPYWRSYLHRRWAHWWLSKGTGARQCAQALLHAQQSADYYRHQANLLGADAGLALQLLAVAQARNNQIEEATASMALGCKWIDTALPKSHPHHLRCEAYSILLAPEGAASRVGMADLLKRSNADALLARDLATAAQWHQRDAAKPNWQSFPFLN